MKDVNVYVRQEHIEKSEIKCPEKCMVANAMYDAGFKSVKVRSGNNILFYNSDNFSNSNEFSDVNDIAYDNSNNFLNLDEFSESEVWAYTNCEDINDSFCVFTFVNKLNNETIRMGVWAEKNKELVNAVIRFDNQLAVEPFSFVIKNVPEEFLVIK